MPGMKERLGGEIKGHNGTTQPALCLPSPVSPYLLQKGTWWWGEFGEDSELENRVSGPRWLGDSMISPVINSWFSDPGVVSQVPKGRKLLCLKELGEIHEPISTCKDPCLGWRAGLSFGQDEGKETPLL